MKNDQISRIGEFLNSLEQSQMGDGQQTLVLQSEYSVIGGRNSNCSNYGSVSCGSTNGDCTNRGDTCSGANRGTCINGPAGLPGQP